MKQFTEMLPGLIVGLTCVIAINLWAAHRDQQMYDMCDTQPQRCINGW